MRITSEHLRSVRDKFRSNMCVRGKARGGAANMFDVVRRPLRGARMDRKLKRGLEMGTHLAVT